LGRKTYENSRPKYDAKPNLNFPILHNF